MERPLPAVPRAKTADFDGRLVASGFDTYQEALNLKLAPRLVDQLDQLQRAAKEMDDQDGQAVTSTIGGEIVQVRPGGMRGGVKWVYGNDDYLVMVRSPKAEWPVSVRYLAAGLWEHGLPALRERAHRALFATGSLGKGGRYAVVSRVDYAFDVHAPSFTGQMVPGISGRVICHANTKEQEFEVRTIGRRSRVETLEIGARGGGLQIVVYDKTREIVEASGKTWMRALWAQRAEGELLDHDVWRLEIRLGADHLKQRNVRTFDHVDAKLPSLLGEALATRRLVVPTADSNPRRWPFHPFWALALDEAGAVKMPAIGRHVTGRRDELAKGLERNIAGTLRSRLVLRGDDVDAVLANVKELMTTDKQDARKKAKAEERYKFVDEAV